MKPVEINLNSGSPVVGSGALLGGSAGRKLFHNGWDPGVLQPFVGDDGNSYVTRRVGMKDGKYILQNAYSPNPALLRKEEWTMLEGTVIKVAKERLRAWGIMVSSGGTFNIPNGMRVPILQHQTMGDITPATISMDGLRKSERDRPELDLRGLPLPIIHKDLSFSLRELEISRNGTTPLDTSSAELAGRRVAEFVEQLTLGTLDTFTYGGYSIYGFTNFPDRNATGMTLPTAAGWSPKKMLDEIIAMKNIARGDKHYGPYYLILSSNWEPYLDQDYQATYDGGSLWERLRRINNITTVQTADYLDGYQAILVQTGGMVARGVTGMNMTTLQWEDSGGLEVNWKIMCIMVPQLRTDQNSNCGIVHGTAV